MLWGKVAVAMSGGVDSAVAALLLKRAGYHVHGIFMRTWNADDDSNPISDCPWRKDMEDARLACESIGMSFEVLNMISHYREHVVKELVDGYRNGITPNPDVLCNARIKFGLLKQYALDSGYDYFATGHYCRRVDRKDGTVDIFEGIDKNKDQSYFLAMLSQEQVDHCLFPIGGFAKPDVRQIAEDAQLPNAQKKDSQGICFLGKVKVQDFLSAYIQDSDGDIVDIDGRVLGRHHGLFRFTLGQRHGINIPSNKNFAHYVVIGKNLEKNHLIVALEGIDCPWLYQQEFFVHGISTINGKLDDVKVLFARPRYRDSACRISFDRIDDNRAKIVFDVPQRAVASGQIIAFYDGECLLGGAVFD